MVNSLIDLPPDVLTDILARLPLKSLVAAKCLCKTFFNLISPLDSNFTVLYSANATQVVIFLDRSRLYLMDPEDIEFCLPRTWETWETATAPICELPDWVGCGYRISNLCNGLLYIIDDTRRGGDKDSLVCNPITNEYLVIPVKDDEGHSGQGEDMWLGFSPSSNQYKILKILIGADKVAEGRLLEVGSMSNSNSYSWRAIEGAHTHPTPGRAALEHPTFLDGVIYWWSLYDGYSHVDVVIDSFDFEREEFEKLEVPKYDQLEIQISLGVLQNCLCLFCNHFYSDVLVIWMMEKRSNNQRDWSRKFVVDVTWYTTDPFHILCPLQVLSNGDILMSSWYESYDDMVRFNPKTKCLKFVKGPSGFPLGGTLIPTFVSLKDIFNVDNTVIANKNRFNLDMLKRDNQSLLPCLSTFSRFNLHTLKRIIPIAMMTTITIMMLVNHLPRR